MKIKHKYYNKIFSCFLIITLLVGSFIIFFSSFVDSPLNLKIMAVYSGSMEPTLKRGSMVFIKKEKKYSKGDIITFRSKPEDIETTTHRIVVIREASKGETTSYITKGDFNKTPDIKKVLKPLVLGKVIISIPWLGYIVIFSKTLAGLVILIVIPATIIIYSELINLKSEAIRLIRERKKRKLTMKEKIEEKIGEEIILVEKEVKKDIKKVFGKKKKL